VIAGVTTSWSQLKVVRSRNSVIPHFPESGSPFSLHFVTQKDLHLGLFVVRVKFIINPLNKGDSHERS
jgi:hypothetical protein